MKQLKLKSFIVLFALVSTTFFACNNDQKTEATDETVAVDGAEAPSQDKVEITLDGNDAMQFDKSEITVSAGQTVVLTLHHSGTMSKESMGHNFVLLTQGTSVSDFATAAMAAKDNDYIPSDQSSNIIAHTKVIGGGESDTITFTAPEKGTYDFLCSFPGHYAMMKGKFIVQ